jgi:outer membrane lipoprotein
MFATGRWTMNKLFILVLALFLSGCAHVISEESLRLVDKQLNFAELRQNPDVYKGKYVLLGGSIAGVKNAKKGSEVEVLQTALDSFDMPEDTYYSGGRFIATTANFLDPLVYKQGRKLTLVGEVSGKRVLAIDEVEYTYPVVAIRELHLWDKYDYSYYYYPPPYYYDPYWTPGPFGPWYWRCW